jgi:hypothetical protein
MPDSGAVALQNASSKTFSWCSKSPFSRNHAFRFVLDMACAWLIVDISVYFGIGDGYVTRLLDRVATFRGYPKEVRSDSGLEHCCRAFMTWA